MRLSDVAWSSAVHRAHAPGIEAPRPAQQGGAFSRLYREVDADVRRFIQLGGGGPEIGSGITPEGAWQRLRSQRAVEPTPDAAAIAGGAADRSVQARFLSGISNWADEAAERLGVSGQLVAAHAALESGWGQKPLRGADGASSHNLFGIKATGHWRGDAIEAMTTEHEGGVEHRRTERFRSYPDLGSAFQDYARLLLDNPRYRAALNTGNDAEAFAQGLARGGYATDPDYARKLVQVARQIQSGD
jgi:peptidoglycan hydrolase FlgJ